MEHHCHHHHHGAQGSNIFIAIVLNVLITLGQVIGGVLSGSMALLSDALHNFSDVMALVISYIAQKLAHRQNTPKQTFGYKKAEIIAAFINSAALLGIGVYIIIESIDRLINPLEVNPWPVIGLGAMSIVLNGLSALLIFRESKDSINMRSALLHLLTDMFTSIAVVIGGILIHVAHVYWVDSVLSIGIALYLMFASWKLVAQSLKIMLMFTPDHIDLEQVKECLLEMDEIDGIHHIHLWQLTDTQIHFEGHISFYKDYKLSEINGLYDLIRQRLHQKFDIDHITLQGEYCPACNPDLINQH